jgi:hypothetical protein
MTVGIEQGTHRDAGDVFVGGRRISACPGRRRQHPERRGHRDQLQVVVGEVARVNRHVRGVRQQLKQLVGQPGMPRHKRWVLGAGRPLPERHHRFQAGAPRGHRKGDRAVERMGVVRRVEVQPVDPVHRGRNLLDVKHIGDDDVGAQGPQPGAARVVAMHHGPGLDSLFQELGGDRAADPARGTGYQYATTHRTSLSS